MTDCPNGDIRDLLPDLLHGRLDAASRVRVEQHVESCEACSEELSLLRDLRATIRRAPVMDAAAVAAAIPPYRVAARTRSWGGWRAAAAIAAIAVGGTSIALLGRESERGEYPTRVVAAPQADSVPVARVAPGIAPESVPVLAARPRGVEPKARTEATPAPVAAPVALAMTGRAIADLSDRELSTLLDEIETLDALPSEDVESGGASVGSIPLETTR